MDRRHIRQHNRAHCEFSDVQDQSVQLGWFMVRILKWAKSKARNESHELWFPASPFSANH